MLSNVAKNNQFVKIGYTDAKVLKTVDSFWDDSLIPGLTDIIGLFHIAICDNSITVYHKIRGEDKLERECIFSSEYNNEPEKQTIFLNIQDLIYEKVNIQTTMD